MLLHNIFTGDIAAWLVNGSSVLQSVSYGTVPPNSGRTLISAGDFNGDGRTDLLWYNVYTGEVSVWLLDGGRLLQAASYGTVPPNSGWTPVGFDDFNGDGRVDVFWYNIFSSDTVTWLLDGSRVLQNPSYGSVPHSSVWQVQIPR